MYKDIGCECLPGLGKNSFSENVFLCGNKVLIFKEEGGEKCLVEMELARSEWVL